MQIFRQQKGATMIEYALLAAVFAIACLTAMYYLSGQTGSMYDRIEGAVAAASANDGEEAN